MDLYKLQGEGGICDWALKKKKKSVDSSGPVEFHTEKHETKARKVKLPSTLGCHSLSPRSEKNVGGER